MPNWIKNHKKLSIIVVVVLIIAVASLLISLTSKTQTKTPHTHSASKTSSQSKSKYKPLTKEQKDAVTKAILESEFIGSIPSKYPISLKFFYFENGSRVWQDRFLMADGKIISSGSPGISLTLHSKYIQDLSKMDLCTLIQTAKANGDLGFYSQYSDASLMWKYKSLLKYKDCFGL